VEEDAHYAELLERAADDYDAAAAQADALMRVADRGRIEAAKAAHRDGGMGIRRIAGHLRVSHTIVARLLKR